MNREITILQNIADQFTQLAAEKAKGSHKPDPVDPTAPPPAPSPVGMITLVIAFVGSGHKWVPPIDVIVNGVTHNFYRKGQNSPTWNQQLWGSRGVILQVPGPIKSVYFLKEQVFDSNHVDMSYKLGALDSHIKIQEMVDTPESHPNFWANWHEDPRLGQFADQVSVRGSVSRRVLSPFYEYNNILDAWSEVTGKFAIYVGR